VHEFRQLLPFKVHDGPRAKRKMLKCCNRKSAM
jgi:hypothetical protein